MELLGLSCALTCLGGRPSKGDSGCASCLIQGARSQTAQWEFGEVLKEATGPWAVGEARGGGKMEFVAHPTRTSQACSFALVTVTICRPCLRVRTLPQPTLTACRVVLLLFCEGVSLEEAWVRAWTGILSLSFPSANPALLLFPLYSRG